MNLCQTFVKCQLDSISNFKACLDFYILIKFHFFKDTILVFNICLL